MRKLLLLFLCGAAATACVDSDYDLSDVETDDIAIGSDDSEFEIPLANIRVYTKDIANGAADIETLLRKADIWLPATLPGGSDHVDLLRIGEASYVDGLFEALLDEMQRDNAKRNAVTDLVWEDHRADFAPLLNVSAGDEQAFREAFSTLYATAKVRNELHAEFSGYLSGELRIDPLRYDLGHVDISEDVVDMLADNLDPEGTPDARNTLHLTGTLQNRLPVAAELAPEFTVQGRTLLDFSVAADASQQPAQIPETQIFAEEFRLLLNDAEILIPVQLTRYYPGRGFAPDANEAQIDIRLHLVKRGSLKLDI